jgi:hypothetical protein
MNYKSKDLKIEDILKSTRYLRTHPVGLIQNLVNDIIIYLRNENPKKKYYLSNSLTNKEWEMLLERFDSEYLLNVYENFLLIKKKSEINLTLNNLRKEFDNYFLNHEKIIGFAKPIKLAKNLTIKNLKTKFEFNFRYKLQDDDYIYSAFVTEIEGFKFYFELENTHSYSSYPLDNYNYFKENLQYFENKIESINIFLFRNIYRYKIFDLKKVMEDIYTASLNNEDLNLDYYQINKMIYDQNIVSEEIIPSFETLYVSNLSGYDYFKCLDELKSINNYKKINYLKYGNKVMKNIKLNTKNKTYILLETNINQTLTNDIICTIKTKDELEEILLKTYNNGIKYKLLGEINDDFYFEIIQDNEINSKEKFMKFYKKLYISSLNENFKYYLFEGLKL